MEQDDIEAIIILGYIIGVIIGGILLFIWFWLEFGGFGIYVFGGLYIVLVSMPFWDWGSRYDAQRDAQDKDKRRCDYKKKRGWE